MRVAQSRAAQRISSASYQVGAVPCGCPSWAGASKRAGARPVPTSLLVRVPASAGHSPRRPSGRRPRWAAGLCRARRADAFLLAVPAVIRVLPKEAVDRLRLGRRDCRALLPPAPCRWRSRSRQASGPRAWFRRRWFPGPALRSAPAPPGCQSGGHRRRRPTPGRARRSRAGTAWRSPSSSTITASSLRRLSTSTVSSALLSRNARSWLCPIS